jgi:hypothetical protein
MTEAALNGDMGQPVVVAADDVDWQPAPGMNCAALAVVSCISRPVPWAA